LRSLSAAGSRWHPDLAALRTPAVLFGLGLAALAFHWPSVSAGLIPIEDDVRVFYFPLLVATKDALARLTLPLWTPGVFGGYPLFADGEAGALYPLNLLILPWLSAEASLVALTLVHSWLASVFTYALLRTLGGGRLGGIVGGLCFAYSGFAAGQIIHANVSHALVWLPLELLLVERAMRSDGASRYRYAVLAGGIVGVQALASHMQVTLMSGLVVAAFLAYRGLPGTEGVGSLVRRVAIGLMRSAAGLAIVGAIGVSIGAVQLFPLYELGSHTVRGSGVDAPLAAINSIWPGDLLTLILPRLHDTAQGGFWGPWVRWETTIYVGIMPLALAVLALCTRSGRYRPFFGALAFVALLLTLGAEAPIPLWSRLHELPGFGVLRSPGRYSLVFSLCIAVLAGYGADWLWRRARPAPFGAAVVLLIGGGAALGLGIALDLASAELHSPSAETLRQVHDYVGLPGIPPAVDGLPLSAERVAGLAADALALTNPATAWQLALIGSALAVVIVMLLVGYLGRARAPARVLLDSVMIGMVGADLLAASAASHPLAPLSELRPRVPAVLLTAAREPYRVYTQPPVDEKNTQVEPNRLLTAGIQEANGYSSLEPDRHAAYVASVEYSDGQLLDLWNARYIVRRARPELLPSMGGTSFHPERPLYSGKRPLSGGDGVFLPDGGPAVVDEVRVIGALWDAAEVPDEAEVARIVLDGADGSSHTVSVVAGRHIADARLNVPSRPLAGQHGSPTVAFQYPRANPESPRFGEQLYYGRIVVEPSLDVARVRIEPAQHAGGLEVYGIGLLDTASGEVTQARAKAKYQQVYRDDEVRIYENAAAMPRAFLVGQAVVARDDRAALSRLQDADIDVRRTVIIEGPPPTGVALPANVVSEADQVGTASVASYENEGVQIRTSSLHDAMLVLTDPYYPGWVARIDGHEAPILRADYLFRAVAVPAGAHTVTFSFEPTSVALGGALTLLGALAVLVVIGFRAAEAVRDRVGRRMTRPRAIPEPVYASADVAGGLEG
jgi:Bacterial membrane protein YfhO